MSDRQIYLPEEIYQNLIAAADSSGMTPEDWIAAQLPKVTNFSDRAKQWQQLQQAFGTWREDLELEQIFFKIDEQRHIYRGREFNSESFEL
ncbi:MAG: hypothetical protein AAFR63_08715 [Cyanobacteria bacterium J06631_6]